MDHRYSHEIAKTLLLVILEFFILLPNQARASLGWFAAGPDSNQGLLLSAIQSARQELLINIYQMDQPAVVSAILDKINQGISVTILIESTPVGGMGATALNALNTLQSAMNLRPDNRNHIYLMTQKEGEQKRRFRFDHAKYVVIDGRSAYVTSENFTSPGHPDQGRKGNRGWDSLVEDTGLAQELADLFKSDTDPQYGDITEYAPVNLAPPEPREGNESRNTPGYPARTGVIQHFTLVTAPQSLNGVLTVIRSAKKRLRVEEMTLPLYWRSPDPAQNPIVTELIQAAERGVRVQVLLNDESVFRHSTHRETLALKVKGNDQTAQYLDQYGKKNHIPLEARIVNVNATQITYIHNKGIIGDDQTVFISSINGTQNSVKNNREVGVALESPEAATYFSPIFDFDWQQSGPKQDPSLIPSLGMSWIMQFFWRLNA